MSTNEEEILTDEELDEVVGGNGRTYYYELIHSEKGDYDYYCCLVYENGVQVGKKSIVADRWNEFVDRVTGPERKDFVAPMSELRKKNFI